MTGKEVAAAFGINKKEVVKDLIIIILVLALIFSVLFVIKARYANCVEVKEPLFLETKVTAYVEDNIAYIPLTFLDNLETGRYVKSVILEKDNKTYIGEFEESDLNTKEVPRIYKGSRRFYQRELIDKPYAIRKQTIKVNGIDLDMTFDKIKVTYNYNDEKEYDFSLDFTNDLEKRSVIVDEDFVKEAEILEGVAILMTYPEFTKQDSGEFKLNRKGISAYLEKIYE